jgi:hypothetical protein
MTSSKGYKKGNIPNTAFPLWIEFSGVTPSTLLL